MRYRLAFLLAGTLLAHVGPIQAQSPRPVLATAPARFESWSAAPAAHQLVAIPRHRQRQALIGGAIGAAAGVVFCTAISTLSNDSAEGGLSFCPVDSYLLIGGAGFALGAIIGWVI